MTCSSNVDLPAPFEFGNRFIVDYVSGQDALMEAERIKQELFIMEHDLWEY